MTALVRNHLIPLLNATCASKEPNAGLLIQRGLRVWDIKDKEKADKKDLIEVITNTQPSKLYQLAFDRWLLATEQQEHFATVAATVDGRLMSGLALGGTLETGVATQHSYGMPFLAGSSVKGAVRAYAESLFSLKDADGKVVLTKDDNGIDRVSIDPEMQPILTTLFGEDDESKPADAGYLVWHDAWLIPALTREGQYNSNGETSPFVAEVVTVHHPDYYVDKDGKEEALDMESPIPNQQLAVQGSFYFVIEGANQQWCDFAQQLLENMLQQFGLGAKGAAGYGYFKEAEKKLVNQLNDLVQKQINKGLPEYDQFINELKEKILKSPKGGGIGGNPLGQALKDLIAKAEQWPPESYPKLRSLAQSVYDHVGADRKKKGAAKDLWQTLPQ